MKEEVLLPGVIQLSKFEIGSSKFNFFKIRITLQILSLLVILLFHTCALGAEKTTPIAYSVTIDGTKDSELIELLRSVSDSLERRDNPPPTLLLL